MVHTEREGERERKRQRGCQGYMEDIQGGTDSQARHVLWAVHKAHAELLRFPKPVL